ncbi:MULTISPECIES: glycosyltransferase [unclassified Clostridium]|jgi:hypothetical protein|uniref:glycosyltransferase n=1 Tax=unclassified Clostridium TaxID=2614128 RepID=UPI001106C882|nr:MULTISPECIES: glycosyltransferase [unclassified Clostridium]
MNIVIVTNSASYEPRAEKIGQYFQKLGYNVLWLESDFIHREKKKGRLPRSNHRYIETVVYKKNLSIRRLYSQYDFARKVFHVLKNEPVDLLYVMIPANSLARTAVKLKKILHTKVVLDIIDMWPESLPLKGVGTLWPLQCWRRLRDDNLGQADLVFTECGLYKRLIGLKPEEAVTLYWPKDKGASEWAFQKDDNCMHVVYLGSVNNIIDMNAVTEILREVNRSKKVKLHIVGDGEKRQAFLEILKQNGIETEYYGTVYDETKKQEIFDRCSYGINIMKPGVCVGLTMKSIDYFCYGLPIINNIQGDTWEMVEQYGIGINCIGNSYKECASDILLKTDALLQKRGLIQKLYNQYFTVEAMERVLEKNVLPLLEKEE